MEYLNVEGKQDIMMYGRSNIVRLFLVIGERAFASFSFSP